VNPQTPSAYACATGTVRVFTGYDIDGGPKK